ncbi:MAG: STAS domain-containing protein [Gammaproteobacteria bacterium]|nr:STAS domain-containing protein [Gammaproteobacteria bacterium]
MSDLFLNFGIATYVSQHTLIVPFQNDFYSDAMEALRSDIAHKLHHTPGLKGLVVDVSQIALIDLENMKVLEDILKLGTVLGVTSYLTGLQSHLTQALVELGYEPGDFKTAPTIEKAMQAIYEHKDW